MTSQTNQSSHFLAENALATGIVYFYDGNRRTFYHLGRGRSRKEPSRSYAVADLQRQIDSYHQNVKVAIIYDAKTREEIKKKKHGVWL